jgi:hypothetical protein
LQNRCYAFALLFLLCLVVSFFYLFRQSQGVVGFGSLHIPI